MAKGVFEDIKIVDFSWAAAGPLLVRHFADHGAEVIHVEWPEKPDIVRTAPPFKDRKAGLDRSAYFAVFNANKYGMTLNLNHPKASQVTRRLVSWADVIVESFRPGIMAQWGLSYEEIKKSRPDLIMVSTSQMGQTGPLRSHAAAGTQLVSLAGFTYITGWPDRVPTGPFGPYTDVIAPLLGAAALAAALDYRRRTGKGLYIDLSQYEAGLHFICHGILDYTANGRIMKRQGNRHPFAVPHGAYPCLGEDRWCVIAVTNDEQWQALCEAFGEPQWISDIRFSSFVKRKENEDALDILLRDKTREYEAQGLMKKLQDAGVPCGVVCTSEDLHNDPQMAYRGFLQEIDHPEIGIHACDAPPFKLSETPWQLRMPGPCIGEHNYDVCSELLGIPDEEFAELMSEGVI